jgi:hypothetical protein
MLELDALPADVRWPAAYLLHIIRWRSVVTWQADEDGWTRLHSRLLDRAMTREGRRRVHELLVGREIIEVDGEYRRGRQCYGYRIARGYERTRKLLCEDEAMNKRLWRMHAENDRCALPDHRWLRTTAERVTIDFAAAFRVINRFKRPSDKVKTADHRHHRRQYVEMFQDGENWRGADPRGRCHSLMTSLECELRPFLRIDGERLAGYDLANSQPLLLGHMLRKMARMRKDDQKAVAEHAFEEPEDAEGRWDPYFWAVRTSMAGGEGAAAARACARNTGGRAAKRGRESRREAPPYYVC